MDYLSYLEADYRRLAAVCAGRLGAPVPTCPEWTVDDLVRHVSMVYLHKVECMRRNARPEPWPPDLSGEPAEALLDRAYAALSAEFAVRAPESPTFTWFEPDQTVGFWRRRMAHETVIHRIDAELAAGVDSQPIPDELALDGIDELLQVFVAWASRQYPEDFAEILSAGPGSVAIVAPTRRWLVSWGPEAVDVVVSDARVGAEIGGTAEAVDVVVSDASGGAEIGGTAEAVDVVVSDARAGAEIRGTAEAVMRWLWRRAESGVTVDDDKPQVAQMRQLLHAATQ